MSNLPSSDFNADLGKDITLKAAVSDATKAEMFYVDPDKVEKYTGFNVRVTGRDYDQDILELADHIRRDGFRDDKPLTVIAKEDDQGKTLLVVDGHRRLDAVATVNRDAPGTITRIPVVLAKSSDLESLTYGFFSANSGSPLTPYESAVAVSRIHKMLVAKGKTAAEAKTEIAEKTGFTERYIGEMLFVCDVLPASIQKQIASGKVAMRNAISEFRADPKNAAKTLKKAEDDATKAGKDRVTPKALAKAKTETAVETKKAAPKKAAPAVDDAPATDADFYKSAMQLALEIGSPAQGLAFIRQFLAEDAAAIGKLEEYMSQPEGSFADASLRKPVFDL